MKICQATDVTQVHDSALVPGVSCLVWKNDEHSVCWQVHWLTLTGSLRGMQKLGNALAFYHWLERLLKLFLIPGL